MTEHGVEVTGPRTSGPARGVKASVGAFTLIELLLASHNYAYRKLTAIGAAGPGPTPTPGCCAKSNPNRLNNGCFSAAKLE